MSSYIGNIVRVDLFGQSHSEALGCVIDGLPAGKAVDVDALAAFLQRRAPSGLPWSTPRKEADAPQIICGLKDGLTCGAPLCALIQNTNTRSSDYDLLARVPRPGHADYVANLKYHGAQDYRGGGHFSGRITAALCIAGGIAKQLLESEGIHVGAHIAQIGNVCDEPFDSCSVSASQLEAVSSKRIPVNNDDAGAAMVEAIAAVREAGDSIGGIVECAAVGLPAGIGEPMFNGIENAIARICFGIPAVKGVEFGAGFKVAAMRGSENNDGMRYEGETCTFESNNAGGALGGISTGAPVVVRCAFKPTPSISVPQHSIDMKNGGNEELCVTGRHDPCVVVRAVPVVEAAVALAVYDLYLEAKARQ